MDAPAPPTRHDLVIAADRLPVEHTTNARGRQRWRERSDGFVGALRSVVAARRGAWVGRAEATGTTVDPFIHDNLWLHPLPLPQQDTDDYHDGYCTATLAPLYHGCVQPAVFHRRWREAYRRVNQRFADRIAEIAAPGGVVWVHDHHLQLVPGYLRQMRPDLLIGFFLHSPFPPAELFLRLPMRKKIMRGLLGADLIGFQQPRAAANFIELADQLLRTPTGDNVVHAGDRRVKVGVFPMSIDVAEVEDLADDPQVRAAAGSVRSELSDPDTVFLAVARPAPADGTTQILDAYGEMLADGSLDPRRTVLILVAVPGPDTAEQERLHALIDHRVARINGLHSRIGHPVIHYVRRRLHRSDLVALYVAADVMLATPLRAGMTPEAKEYIAAHTDNSGYLVLSEFTATATDLPQAHIVNPHDTDALRAAMLAAATPGDGRAPAAMNAMRAQIRATDIYRWAGRFLSDLGDCVATTYQPPAPSAQSRPETTAAGRDDAAFMPTPALPGVWLNSSSTNRRVTTPASS